MTQDTSSNQAADLPGVPRLEDLDSFYLAFLYPGPNFSSAPPATPEEMDLFQAHVGWVIRSQLPGGPAVAGGPIMPEHDHPTDPTMPIGVMILRAVSTEEAQALANQDPGVRAGHYRSTVCHWLVPRGQLR